MSEYRSWGHTPLTPPDVVVPAWRHSRSYLNTAGSETSVLPFGRGRSYGDSCLNSEGILLDTRQLNNVIEFDRVSGLFTCESGVSFSDIINIVVPNGWFLPVTPGTRFITVGGAIANDVHGKNHHKSGTFGCFVTKFQLVRSNGETLICSKYENSDLFNATIGGLGLTGFVTWVQFQLIRIESTKMSVVTTPFHGLDEFIELSSQTAAEFDYSVAWLDCLSGNEKNQRGLFYAANHAKGIETESDSSGSTSLEELNSFKLAESKLSVPFPLPGFVLNKWSVKAFNSLYYYQGCKSTGESDQSIDQYFYPLDGISHWNRIYGFKGFIQYQFVIPKHRKDLLSDILTMISNAGNASFLTVLKEFGTIESPGLLSFPREGLCLALDFTNQSKKTLQVLDAIDNLLVEAGGALYPAKDQRMSKKCFQAFYPQFNQFSEYVDPSFSSDFWRRVSG